MSAAHTQGLLRLGRGGCIVADHPVDGVSGSDEVAYYGGHMVAESIGKSNARRLVACWNACASVPTEVLEAGTSGGLPWSVADQIDQRAKHSTLLTDRDLLLLERDMLRAALSKSLSCLERSEKHTTVGEWNAILNEGYAALGETVVPPAPAAVLPTEAVAIGAALDCASLEQGEPA